MAVAGAGSRSFLLAAVLPRWALWDAVAAGVVPAIEGEAMMEPDEDDEPDDPTETFEEPKPDVEIKPPENP